MPSTRTRCRTRWRQWALYLGYLFVSSYTQIKRCRLLVSWSVSQMSKFKLLQRRRRCRRHKSFKTGSSPQRPVGRAGDWAELTWLARHYLYISVTILCFLVVCRACCCDAEGLQWLSQVYKRRRPLVIGGWCGVKAGRWSARRSKLLVRSKRKKRADRLDQHIPCTDSLSFGRDARWSVAVP